MKLRFGMSYAHYNEDFAKAVINAWFGGKKTFAFMRKRYTTDMCIGNVMDDIKNHRYKTISIKMS